VESDEEEDDSISAEDMATKLNTGKHLPDIKENLSQSHSSTTSKGKMKVEKKLTVESAAETMAKRGVKSPIKPPLPEKGKGDPRGGESTTTSTTPQKLQQPTLGEKKELNSSGPLAPPVPPPPSHSSKKSNTPTVTTMKQKPSQSQFQTMMKNKTNHTQLPPPPKLRKDLPSSSDLYSKQVKILVEMGFAPNLSRHALEKSSGNVDLAASFLLQQLPDRDHSTSPPPAPTPLATLPPQSLPPQVKETNKTRVDPPLSIPITPVSISEQRSETLVQMNVENIINSTTTAAAVTLDLDHHCDADFDDLLLVPSSYESFTTQLQKQIDDEAKSWGSGGIGGSGATEEKQLNTSRQVPLPHSLDPQPSILLSSSPSSSLPSFLSHSTQLESEFFPSLGQIFTHEPPTLQLFPQTAPQLFQTELFLGSSPSTSSVSSTSLLSGDTLDDHPFALPDQTNSAAETATTASHLLLSSVDMSNIISSLSSTTSPPSTASSSMTVSSSLSATPCMYHNTHRGCRNSFNCKFSHSENSHPSTSSSSTPSNTSTTHASSTRTRLTSNHPSSSTSSSSSHRAPAKVCAFHPTPAGCKLGNSCKFLHQQK
jgi:hypothetical protein